jgi:outer membrane protein assembly factor BamA
MRRQLFLLPLYLAALVSSHPVEAQKFIPKSIKFQGDPEYSNEELIAAAGLKKGVALSFDDIKAYTQRLMDTGVFSNLAFKFDGQDLIFTIAPSTDLYSIQLDNLPLTPGPDLDGKLHTLLPLYHGKVPADGGLTEAVRAALEKMLADEGLQATVAATTVASLATQKVNAVSYSITAPPVQVSITGVSGVSDAMQSKVQPIVAGTAKLPFSSADSASNLEHAVQQFYGDQGYAAAKVEAQRDGTPSLVSGAIIVPFSLQIQEGRIYKVASIKLPPGTPVTQEEIDKALAPSASGPPQGVCVRSIWGLVASRYHAKGNLDCKVTPHAELDDADATVSYTVDVDPGPVYHLAFVKFDNVSDQLRTMLIHNWQMLPGDPFDEGYVANFLVKAQMQDPVLARSLAGVRAKYDVTANPNTHEVNVVIRLEK